MKNTHNSPSSQPNILNIEEILNSFGTDTLNVCEYIKEAGVFVTQKNGKYGIINSFGRILVPTYASRVVLNKTLGHIQEPLNPVLNSNRDIICSRCTAVELKPVLSYHENMCISIVGENYIVTDGKKFGIADSHLQLICDYKYDEIDANNTYKNTVIPYRTEKHWGLISANGEIILPAKYKSIGNATEYGYTDVIRGRKKYSLLIYNKNNSVCTEEYEGNLKFTDGISPVRKNNLMGYIDTDGNIVHPIDLYYAFSFFNGMAKVVKDGYIGFVNTKGELSVPTAFSGARDFYDNRCAMRSGEHWGYVSNTGELITKFIYKEASDFINGFARVVTPDDVTLIIDKSGNVVLTDTDTEKIIGNPTAGMVPYQKGELFGFKYIGNSTSLYDIPAEYEMVKSFSGPHAVVTQNGMLGRIDKTSRIRLDTIFENITDFSEQGIAVGTLADGSSCFLTCSQDNPEAIVMMYYDAIESVLDNLIIVARLCNDTILYGIVSIYDTPIVPIIYTEIINISERYFILKNENGIRLARISVLNEVSLSDFYDYIDTTISDDRILVCKNNFYGYINTLGECVIDCVYEDAFAFSGGLALVKLEEMFGYINRNGDIVIDTIYQTASENSFQWGYAIVARAGLYGIINRLGNELVPCKYITAEIINQDTIMLKDKNGVWWKTNFIQRNNLNFIDKSLGIYTEGDTIYIHDEEIFSLGAVKNIQNFQLSQIVSERYNSTNPQLV